MTNKISADKITASSPDHEATVSMTCAEFQEQLPEFLAAGTSPITDHPHLQHCANCAALVRDLEYIAEAARQLMPAHDPSPDVWSQIQSTLARESVLAEPILEPDTSSSGTF